MGPSTTKRKPSPETIETQEGDPDQGDDTDDSWPRIQTRSVKILSG